MSLLFFRTMNDSSFCNYKYIDHSLIPATLRRETIYRTSLRMTSAYSETK